MKRLFILASAAALFAACSVNDGLNPGLDTERVPLTISVSDALSAPVVGTRSNVNNIQSTVLDPASTAQIGVYVLPAGQTASTPAQEYMAWNAEQLEYVAHGSYTDVTIDGSLYYPASKTQKVDIYAYVPKGNDVSSNISTETTNVAIQANQSTKANYLLSDVLWGRVGDGTGDETASGNHSNAPINAANHLAAKAGTATNGYVTTTGEVIIPMFHKAAKIIVKITPVGMDVARLKGATVKFYVNGTNTTTPIVSTALNVSSGAITALIPAATPVIAPMVFTDKLGKDESDGDIPASASDGNGTQGAIGDGSTISGYACSGIILPQTLKKGNTLIEIVLSDNTTYAYKIPTEGSDITFASGNVYTYTIAVTASSLTLTTTVADWNAGSSISDSATLQ